MWNLRRTVHNGGKSFSVRRYKSKLPHNICRWCTILLGPRPIQKAPKVLKNASQVKWHIVLRSRLGHQYLHLFRLSMGLHCHIPWCYTFYAAEVIYWFDLYGIKDLKVPHTCLYKPGKLLLCWAPECLIITAPADEYFKIVCEVYRLSERL